MHTALRSASTPTVREQVARPRQGRKGLDPSLDGRGLHQQHLSVERVELRRTAALPLSGPAFVAIARRLCQAPIRRSQRLSRPLRRAFGYYDGSVALQVSANRAWLGDPAVARARSSDACRCPVRLLTPRIGAAPCGPAASRAAVAPRPTRRWRVSRVRHRSRHSRWRLGFRQSSLHRTRLAQHPTAQLRRPASGDVPACSGPVPLSGSQPARRRLR
jgi:hypothetical protein